MAIKKTAKNMIIIVANDYNLVVEKKIEKIAGKLNVEAMAENLILASNKKIVSHGNK